MLNIRNTQAPCNRPEYTLILYRLHPGGIKWSSQQIPMVDLYFLGQDHNTRRKKLGLPDVRV